MYPGNSKHNNLLPSDQGALSRRLLARPPRQLALVPENKGVSRLSSRLDLS